MNRFILKNTFIKIYIYHFYTYFYKNKKSKLGFGDRIVVLNDVLYEYGGSTSLSLLYLYSLRGIIVFWLWCWFWLRNYRMSRTNEVKFDVHKTLRNSVLIEPSDLLAFILFYYSMHCGCSCQLI